MRAASCLLAALLLSACGPDPSQPASPPAAAPATTPDPNGWAFAIGKNSVEMAWMTETMPGRSPLRLVCARNDGFMVEAATLTPVASEERLSIGAGDTVVALVAVAGQGAHGPRIRATGPVDEGLLTALTAGGPISISYGAQTYGPLAVAAPALRRAFAETCRKLNAGTPV